MGGNLQMQILLYIYIQHLFYYIVPMNMQQFACIPLLLSSYIQGIELIHISALDIYLVLRSSPVILPTELNDSTVDETVRKISNLCPMVEYLDYLDGSDINKLLCKLMQQLKKELIYNTYFSFPPLPPAFHVPRPLGSAAPAAETCLGESRRPRPVVARLPRYREPDHNIGLCGPILQYWSQQRGG